MDSLPEIVAKIRAYIMDELLYAVEVVRLSPEDELLGSGLLDSLASAQLMTYVESTFHIKLKPTDLTYENFNTVSALASLVDLRR